MDGGRGGLRQSPDEGVVVGKSVWAGPTSWKKTAKNGDEDRFHGHPPMMRVRFD